MKILISGKNGYVSKCLNKYKTNHTSTYDFLTSQNLHSPQESYDFFISSKLSKHYDIYIHGASYPRENYSDRDKKNHELLINSLAACKRNKIKKFIFLSSGAVYKNRMIANDENSIVDDKNITKNKYSYYKLLSENYLKDFCSNNNMEFVILRLFSFGGSDLLKRNEFAISSMINSANTSDCINVMNPKVMRSYLHSLDLAKQIEAAITSVNQIYNIGSGNPTQC